MDRQFLEFWGNLLLATAKGQQQIEDLAPWMQGMGSDSHEWASLFRKIYGLEPKFTGSKAWDQAIQQIQTSLKEWMAIIDMVPRSELTAAQKRNQELEKLMAEQQTTIEQLQKLLDEKGIPSSKAMLDFSRLMQTQSEQFQDLMASLGEAFETDKG